MTYYFFDIFAWIILFTFISAPIASIIFFVVSLTNYIIAKFKQKRTPETSDTGSHKKWLVRLIVSAVIMGVIIISEYALIFTFLTELAYM